MSNNEFSGLSENLVSRYKEFQTSEVEINALPVNDRGITLTASGWVDFNEAEAKEAGFEEMDDQRLAIRNIKPDGLGGVSYSLSKTTMGLYERFHTAEDAKNLELAVPVGGCAVLITTEKDGSHKMVLQYRINKNEYSFTPGASAGGIMEAKFDDNGKLKPVEEVYKDHIAKRLEEEVGVASDQIDVVISSVVTEKKPKLHHEIGAMVTTTLSYTEVCEAYSLRKGTLTSPAHLIALPAEKEVIEILVSQLECPLPPSHLGVYISIGYMMVMKEEGIEAAKTWVKSLEEKVEANYSRINEMVAKTGKNTEYMPFLSPSAQGLSDLITALWKAGLLNTVSTVKERTISKEKTQPSELCITGSVHFPKYLTDESDKTRGTLAIESVRNTLMDGYNMVIVVSPVTPVEYKNELEKVAAEVGKGKLILISETGRTYSAARRQAVEEAVQKLSPKYVMTCEIEKKELEKYLQDFLEPLTREGKHPGFVVMNRGIFEKNPNLPFAQDWGEMFQNRAIMRHLIDAGVYPEGTPPLDLLNGTRVAANEEMETNTGVKINPVDLMKVVYEYEVPGDDPGVKMKERLGMSYGVDHYSAAVYHSVSLAAALGIGVEQVSVPYKHDEQQRALEEGDMKEMFERKREAQARAIIDQNFDLLANICRWKEEGSWPGVLVEAIKNKTSLKLRHYSSVDYSIKGGRLLSKN